MAVAKKREFHCCCYYYRRPDCSLDPSIPQEEGDYCCQIAMKNAAAVAAVVVQPG